MEPEEVVRALFAGVAGQDLSIVELFAPDAVLDVDDEPRVGHDQIRRFYAGAFEHAVRPEVEAIFARPPQYAALLRVTTPSGDVRVLDLLEIVDSRIRTLRVLRPPATPRG